MPAGKIPTEGIRATTVLVSVSTTTTAPDSGKPAELVTYRRVPEGFTAMWPPPVPVIVVTTSFVAVSMTATVPPESLTYTRVPELLAATPAGETPVGMTATSLLLAVSNTATWPTWLETRT